MLRLNELKPAAGSRPTRKRVGRGEGSGVGKTAGRGHKGARSRSGGGPKAGFEGGQMPLQRRLPKFGFTSRKAMFNAEVTLTDLARLGTDTVDLKALKQARLVASRARRVKVIATGKLEGSVKVKGLAVTRGARAAIESAGGTVES